MWRTDSLEKTLMLGKIEGGRRRDDRGWDGWMASLTRWTWVSLNSGSWWWIGRPGVLRFMRSQRVRHDWATEVNWTDLLWYDVYWKFCLFSNWICSYCWTFRSSLYILHASTLSTITWKYFFPVCSLPFLLSDYNYVHSKRLRIW